MCNPQAVMFAFTVATTVAQSYQQKQQAEYAEGVAEYNLRKTENEAQRVKNVATERENKVRQEAAELKARQRASFAAAGIDIGLGTPLDLQADTETLAEVDALRIRETGDLQSKAMIEQSQLELDAARAMRESADKQFTLLTGGSTLLGAAGGKSLLGKAGDKNLLTTTATGGSANAMFGAFT
jgi:hypothetical protein